MAFSFYQSRTEICNDLDWPIFAFYESAKLTCVERLVDEC